MFTKILKFFNKKVSNEHLQLAKVSHQIQNVKSNTSQKEIKLPIAAAGGFKTDNSISFWEALDFIFIVNSKFISTKFWSNHFQNYSFHNFSSKSFKRTKVSKHLCVHLYLSTPPAFLKMTFSKFFRFFERFWIFYRVW